MERRLLTSGAVLLASLLGSTLVPVARADAETAGAAAAPVTHRTVYATSEPQTTSRLWKLALSGTGTVRSRAAVASGTLSAAVDVAGGRVLFVRTGSAGDEIWIRETSGTTRFLTKGSTAVFTPGRRGVVVSRDVHDPKAPGTFLSQLVLYRLADGRQTTLLPRVKLLMGTLRYALDGKSIWILGSNRPGEPKAWVGQYGLAERRLLRSYAVRASEGCDTFEILPSGTRAVFGCVVSGSGGSNSIGQLWTLRLATGAVTHRTTLGAGKYAEALNGRLSAREVLISVLTVAPHDNLTYWLGGLDIDTSQVRRLPGSTGYAHGATEY